MVCVQEISLLVGEVRAESSEAESVAMVTAAEDEEEPIHAESQSEHMESSASSVLQVHVESSEAAAQVLTHTGMCSHTNNNHTNTLS